MRTGSGLAEAATIALAVFAVGMPVATGGWGVVIAVTALSNLPLDVRLRARRGVASSAVGALLLADTGFLTTLLYFSGPWNPFTSLYLLYVALAALALGMRWACAVVLAAAGYALLVDARVPVAVLEHEHHGGAGLPTQLKAMRVPFAMTGR